MALLLCYVKLKLIKDFEYLTGMFYFLLLTYDESPVRLLIHVVLFADVLRHQVRRGRGRYTNVVTRHVLLLNRNDNLPRRFLRIREHVSPRLGEDVREERDRDICVEHVEFQVAELAVVERRVRIEEMIFDVDGVVAQRAVCRIKTDTEEQKVFKLQTEERVFDSADARRGLRGEESTEAGAACSHGVVHG